MAALWSDRWGTFAGTPLWVLCRSILHLWKVVWRSGRVCCTGRQRRLRVMPTSKAFFSVQCQQNAFPVIFFKLKWFFRMILTQQVLTGSFIFKTEAVCWTLDLLEETTNCISAQLLLHLTGLISYRRRTIKPQSHCVKFPLFLSLQM